MRFWNMYFFTYVLLHVHVFLSLIVMVLDGLTPVTPLECCSTIPPICKSIQHPSVVCKQSRHSPVRVRVRQGVVCREWRRPRWTSISGGSGEGSPPPATARSASIAFAPSSIEPSLHSLPLPSVPFPTWVMTSYQPFLMIPIWVSHRIHAHLHWDFCSFSFFSFLDSSSLSLEMQPPNISH